MRIINIAKCVLTRCEFTAETVYPGDKAPSPEYQHSATHLLFMTAAHESGGFIFRRQRGFGRNTRGGAFGLWQTQVPSLIDNIKYIVQHRELLDRLLLNLPQECINILNMCVAHVGTMEGTSEVLRDTLIFLQQRESDQLACAFARVHYLRQPGLIPSDIYSMAKYAKQYYNTRGGKASTELYLSAYQRQIKKTEEPTYVEISNEAIVRGRTSMLRDELCINGTHTVRGDILGGGAERGTSGE